MKIEILGSGCKKCAALAENAKAAVVHTGIEADIEKMTDLADIAKAGVMSTPALRIDGKVVSMGKLLTAAEIEALLPKS